MTGPGPTFGEPGRLTLEELQLATRNHGLPLEALRYPITPPGLHYLLIHYDVPAVARRVGAGDRRPRDPPLRLTLADLRALPRVRSPSRSNARATGAP